MKVFVVLNLNQLLLRQPSRHFFLLMQIDSVCINSQWLKPRNRQRRQRWLILIIFHNTLGLVNLTNPQLLFLVQLPHHHLLLHLPILGHHLIDFLPIVQSLLQLAQERLILGISDGLLLLLSVMLVSLESVDEGGSSLLLASWRFCSYGLGSSD